MGATAAVVHVRGGRVGAGKAGAVHLAARVVGHDEEDVSGRSQAVPVVVAAVNAKGPPRGIDRDLRREGGGGREWNNNECGRG